MAGLDAWDQAQSRYQARVDTLVRAFERVPYTMADDWIHMERLLASPPPGWFTSGTHLGAEDGSLEFWGVGIDGLPIWERLKN